VKPVQPTPRRVPVALRDEVKVKLDLEKRGIIKKVTAPTKWNLLRSPKLKQSFMKTQVPDVYIGRNPSLTSKGKGFITTGCKRRILPDSKQYENRILDPLWAVSVLENAIWS